MAALLSQTLRTYTRTGCEHEPITLSCPRGTSISIDVAQYMPTTIENECVTVTENIIQDGVVNAGTEIEIKAPEKCSSWQNELSYSLLQTVVEACQKKRHCKFIASQKSLQVDPCPAVRKFVEVSYKCRPYEFRSKVACENDVIQLMCNPYSRIAIYGASYGKTEYESLQCAQPSQASKDEICPATYTTETVMKICHGQRKCLLTADSATFGKPCKPEVRMTLKVVYTCVPKKVLKDRFDTPPEPDEPQQNDMDHDHDELYDDDQFYKEPEAVPPEPKLQGDLAKDRLPDNPQIISFQPSSVRPPMRNRDDSSLEEHHERYYLYLIISVTVGVLLCLIIITGRIIIQKQRDEVEDRGKDEPKFHKSSTGETTITKGFSGDNISEVEGGDIDLTTPIAISNLPMKNEKSSFNTYTPPLAPYVSIVPTSSSSSGLLIRPPHQQVAMGVVPPPSSILIGSGGLNSNNPSILAQSPSNLANLQFRTLPRQPPTQHINVNRNDSSALVSVIPSPSTFMSGSIMGHHTIRRSTQSGLVEAIPTSMAGSFYPSLRQTQQQQQQQSPALSINTSQHQQYFYG
ncbi:protein eva-1 homolog C-like [Chironomus tepperi]|uniref:protein eva-1 homolog C-like n=1 Tax=Chironomus tepperi TaxID=113505 RepID=UPI00391F4A89